MTSLVRYFFPYEPGSKLVVLGMVIPPLIGNPYNGYINPYYWVDDHPLLYGNNGSLDPSTYLTLVNPSHILSFLASARSGAALLPEMWLDTMVNSPRVGKPLRQGRSSGFQ